MSSDWSKVYLQDVANEITVGFVGSMTKEYQAEGIPFLRSLNVNRFRINNNDLRYVSKEFHKKISKSRLTPGDVVIVRTGKPGTAAVIPDNLSEANCSDLVIVRCGEKIDNKFLCYFLNSSAIAHINAHLVGAVQQHFNVSSAKTLEINLPPLKEQKAIAHILGTLDEKIELNKRTNETLEEIAKRVFKSWFIDFDPVKAKSEGRSTGLPEEINDLFPNSFEDSDLGAIPKGWKLNNLPNIFEFLEGPGIRNWQYTNDETGIKFINIRCINDGDLNVESANRLTEEEALGKYKHFALLENDIVVSSSGTLGKYAIVRKEHLPLNLNTSVIRFRPIKNLSTFSFLYGFIESQLQYELEIRASGSVQRNFGPMHLREIDLLLPNINLLKVHEKYIEDLFKKRKLNLGENNLLSNLRDAILPKLLSGELRIPDAEKMIEEVGI